MPIDHRTLQMQEQSQYRLIVMIHGIMDTLILPSWTAVAVITDAKKKHSCACAGFFACTHAFARTTVRQRLTRDTRIVLGHPPFHFCDKLLLDPSTSSVRKASAHCTPISHESTSHKSSLKAGTGFVRKGHLPTCITVFGMHLHRLLSKASTSFVRKDHHNQGLGFFLTSTKIHAHIEEMMLG